MAALLSYTDFQDDRQLCISTVMEASFNSFLEKTEVKFLREALGISLFNSFYEGIKTENPESKWLNLFNGCDFVSDGKTYHFYGIKSALINYCYVIYQQNKDTINVTSGNVKTKQNNADNSNPIGKMINAQNECIDLIDDLEGFISVFASDYPDFEKGQPFKYRVNILGL